MAMGRDQVKPYQNRLGRLGSVAPILLAIHGIVMALALGGSFWIWTFIGLTAALGIFSFKFGPGRLIDSWIRAVCLLVFSTILLWMNGGANSYFLLWYFVIVAIYPIVLERPVSWVLPFFVFGAYLSISIFIPGPIPLVVIVARSLLLLFIGMITYRLGRILLEYINEIDLLIREASDGIFITDLDGNFTEVNKKARLLLGYTRDELLQMNAKGLIAVEVDPSPIHFENLKAGESLLVERILTSKDGRHLPVEVSAKMIGSDKILAIVRDISQRKQAEEQLKYASQHDALTGLYNRGFFEAEMGRLERSREFPISILMVDLDHLKKVNDSHGHDIGDLLLKRVANVLTKAFRKEDIIARIGGDEFAVLLPKTSAVFVNDLVMRVRQSINDDNNENPEIPLRLSLGVDTSNSPLPLSVVLKRADQNLYHDKQISSSFNDQGPKK